MAYTSDIAKILADQLTKFAILNRHQLAGHAANLDFWMAEVRHCLDVIDGYGKRFEQLRVAQARHAAEHGTVEFSLRDPRHTQQSAAPPRRVPHSELEGARRGLCDATYRFLVRGFHQGFIEATALRQMCDRLGIGIEASDLRQGTPRISE
jgi:hypothetical protein